MHVLFQIKPRLITYSFLVDELTALGIRLTRFTITRRANSFKGETFSFLSVFSVWHYFGIWFLPYPKLFVFTFLRTKGNCLVSVIWKITTCWFFGALFLCTNHGHCLPLTADAYMANREWDSLMTMAPNTYMWGLKRDGFSTITILGYDFSQLTASVSHLLST